MQTLAELRKALNKVKDKDRLSQFSVTPKLWGFEDPEAQIGIHFYGDEGSEEWEANMKMYDDKAFQEVEQFFRNVEQAVKTCIAADLDDNVFEQLCENEPV